MNKAPMKGTYGQLVVRADATTEIGTGHLMRCLALAQTWLANGGDVTFLSHCQSDALRRRIEGAGIGFVSLASHHPNPSDLPTTLAELERLAAGFTQSTKRWLALDGYHFDATYQEAVQGAGYKLLVIDDTAHLPHYHADVLLNQNINAERLKYCCDPNTVLLLGTKYVLLRPEFEAWRHWRREIPRVARKVLVTMGGGDPENVTLKVIKALEQVEAPALEAKIVVGPANPHLETLRQAVQGSSGRMELLTDVCDMPRLMAWADVAISAGGSTCWELAFMGLPTLFIEFADNQQSTAEGLAEAGIGVNLGWHTKVSVTDIAEALQSIFTNRERVSKFSEQGHRLVDCMGSERTVAVIKALDGRLDETSLRIRRADLLDVVHLWRLANDSAVRANSLSPSFIPFEAHLKWYKDRLSSVSSRIWILEMSGTLVSQVRYDRVAPDLAEIDFAVIPAFRGKGLGSKALKITWPLACNELGVKRIQGVVRRSNMPSARAFLKGGFSQVDETQVLGHPCYVFEKACC